MDVKKSYRADLDRQRAFNFLLGLVVVLSLFIVALEFTVPDAQPETGDDVLDDLSQDIEMMPVVSRDAIAAASAAGKKTDVAGKITVTDTPAADVDADILPGVSDVAATLAGMGISSVTDIQNTYIPVSTVQNNDNPLNFQVIERLPEYPGGMSAFVQWLTENLKYPVTAQRSKVQGTVLVAFIVNKDGSITDLKVVKSVSQELDREALRVLRLMPKWKPGEDHGKPCRTYFSIPIVFKL